MLVTLRGLGVNPQTPRPDSMDHPCYNSNMLFGKLVLRADKLTNYREFSWVKHPIVYNSPMNFNCLQT